jgi:ubiquinone/menaquinone biosynthesis C-methylase UbiE
MTNPPICDYEGSDYQNSFWETGGREYEDAVEAVALQRLMPSSGSRLLELGAGAGRNTTRYRGFQQVTLLDYSHSQLEQARDRLRQTQNPGNEYRFVAADIYQLPFVSGVFDAATMIRTLHHLSEPVKALLQVRRVLQPEAAFILEYANKLNLKSIFRYLLRRQDWSPFTREPVEFVELNYDFHPAAIRSWLAEAGFKLEKQLTVSHYRIAFFKKIFPLKLLVWMDSVAQKTGDWWQLSPSVFTRSCSNREGIPATIDAFFACPACGVPLSDTPPLIVCPNCGKQYPVQDCIYDFRLDRDA